MKPNRLESALRNLSQASQKVGEQVAQEVSVGKLPLSKAAVELIRRNGTSCLDDALAGYSRTINQSNRS
jgi:hypothetical protein